MSDYGELAAHYDVLFPPEEAFRQEPFFRALIERYGIRTCLDCACGTAAHLHMLTRLGLECAGSDASTAMLAAAARRLDGLSVPLNLADFRELGAAWPGRFDLVICMTTSLPHMLTDEDGVAALRSMRDRLAPGGVLVVDSGIGDALLDERPRLIPARMAPDRQFWFFLDYLTERVVVHVLHVWHEADALRHATYPPIVYRALRQATLAGWLATAGLGDVDWYGDHAFAPYEPGASRRIVAVARRA